MSAHPERLADGALVMPGTGEVIDLTAATPAELAQALDYIGEHLNLVHDARQAIADELRRRMDRAGQRTAQLGDFVGKTNAPTIDTYPEPALRVALEQLVRDGHLDAEVIAVVIEEGEPRVVIDEPKVRKAEVNKLLKSDNTEVLRALGKVRVRQPNARTMKVERRPS